MTTRPDTYEVQPCCEACWIDMNATRDAERHVTEVARPVTVAPEHATVETCSWCGEPTFVGIFVRMPLSQIERVRRHSERSVSDAE